MKLPWCSPWHLTLGLSAWAAWFVVVYGGTSLACHTLFAGHEFIAVARIGLIALTLLAALLFTGAAVLCVRSARALPDEEEADAARFITASSAALYGLAACSIIFVGLPLWLLPACV
jgi:hypothetical protein